MKQILLIAFILMAGIYSYALPDIDMITRSIAFIISAFLIGGTIGSLVWAYVWHVQKRNR
ncbi:MAG: hypothetical protein PHV08_08065 [Sulfurovaceae bacterium]|nr:hypothetical protein [Sulfurovaceae bacterium]